MSSLPPRPTLPQTSTSKPRPNPNITSIERTSPVYLKRRSTVYAVGIAVIAVAGALIGASLKTRRQQQDESQSRNISPDNSPETLSAQSQQSVLTPSKINSSKQKSDPKIEQARIESLMAARAKLMYQRQNLERKIKDLQERQRKNQEMEIQRQEAMKIGEQGPNANLNR